MKRILTLLLVIILSCSFALATVDIGNYSVNEKYSESSFLKGWIELNFTDEPLGGILTDSLGNSVLLKNALDLSGFSYTCPTDNCEETFVVSNPESSKTFDLIAGQEKIIGFKLTGTITDIMSISLNITSDAAVSSTNQLKIDLLNDGEIETGNSNPSIYTVPQVNEGCFKDTISTSEGTITTTPYCQRMELTEAPGFMIGAWIKEETAGTKNFTMSLYTKEGNFSQKKCDLDKADISTEGSFAYCDIEYLTTIKEDYYICIASGDGDGDYKIEFYSSEDPDDICGFAGLPIDIGTGVLRNEVGAYKIVSKAKKFAEVDTISIEDTLQSGEKFSDIAKIYIESEYGSLNCGSNQGPGCMIPIKLMSYADQQITISDSLVNYDTAAAIDIEHSETYNISSSGIIINSDKQKLTLDNLFQLPSNEGKLTDYALRLNGEDLFTTDITIEALKAYLNIRETAVSFPNDFVVNVGGASVSSYDWDFGDNTTVTTSTNTVSHTYSQIKNYTLTISFIDSSGEEFSQSFPIIVSSPEELIGDKISSLKSDLSDIKNQIQSLDQFSKQMLESEFDIDELESSINTLEAESKESKTPQEMEALILEILSVNMPSSISETSTPKKPYYISKENIEVSSLQDVTGDYIEDGTEDSVKNAIIFWTQQNIRMEASVKDVAVNYEDRVEAQIKIFEISLSPREYLEDAYYLIIRDAGELNISGEEPIEVEGYKAIRVDSAKTITFSMSGVDLGALPLYITPSLSQLSIQGEIEEEPVDSKKYILIILIFGVLLMIGLTIFLVLKRWYKVKYEKYLFKDRNNLYNVMIYVNNMKKQNISNDDIKKSLSKSGWSGEQIRYIMRKYEGKNTGMYEISSSKPAKVQPKGKQPAPEKNPVNFSTQESQGKLPPKK